MIMAGWGGAQQGRSRPVELSAADGAGTVARFNAEGLEGVRGPRLADPLIYRRAVAALWPGMGRALKDLPLSGLAWRAARHGRQTSAPVGATVARMTLSALLGQLTMRAIRTAGTFRPA